ncbi:DNA cytosine methyltransferase [Roseateles sp.]|uniref:DNA cytosine methyltransferase n=1 Tax=Roseateles sp. TaxID=1971397 RepID=UPI0039283FCE
MTLQSVELFAGAGGLAMGVAMAGFQSRGIVEWDRWACDTVRQNKERGHPLVESWPVHEGDVRQWIRNFAGSGLATGVDLVAGGPPCQPFSMGGKHRAFNDHRDMFPAAVEVVRTLRPRAFVFENVKGLTRASFHTYFQYIQLQLEWPEIVRRVDESWNDHLARLQSHKTKARRGAVGLQYRVVTTLVNAANFGVPQRRERVFMVGFRSDVDAQWSFPRETHSLDALLHDQWVSGDYWEQHRVAKRHRPEMPANHTGLIARLRGLGLPPMHQPWQTVRDALIGLPEPRETEHPRILNHRLQAGARSYPGHTGSPLDLPAKTLKAGDHGVPGGENMLVRPDGSIRYFTVRESARLQNFPDGYELHGSWSEAMRQLGNAVPVRLGQVVASSVAEHLLRDDERRAVAALKTDRDHVARVAA